MRLAAVAALCIAVSVALLVGCAAAPEDGGNGGGNGGPTTPTFAIAPAGNPLMVLAGQRVYFTMTRTDLSPPQTVTATWSVTGDVGTIGRETGVFTATETTSSTSPVTGKVRATTALGSAEVAVQAGVQAGGITSISILVPPGVDLNNVRPGQTIQFAAEGRDYFGNRSVGARLLVSPQWTCDAALGTIDQTGLFVASAGQQTTAVQGYVRARLGGPIGWSTAELALRKTFPAQLSVEPTEFDFGNDGAPTATGVVRIRNLGSDPMLWSLSFTSDQSAVWLTASRQSGTDSGDVTITATRTGLAAGRYTGRIRVATNVGLVDIPVSMEVSTMSVIISGEGVAQ